MVWTTPKTWSTGELVTAANMNLHVRDNLNALFSPNFGRSAYTSGANHTTTSTSFVNVDATNITFSVTSAGGMYWLGFTGRAFVNSGVNNMFIDIAVDGTRLGDATNGLIRPTSTTAGGFFLVMAPATLTAGSRTITLQWRVSAGTGTLESTTTVNWFYAGV